LEHSEFTSVLEAARVGAEWAWTRLYEDLAGPVHGYAAVRGSPEPEDVVSDTFLQVARHLATFEGGYDGFRSWVFMVAHHRIIDDRRRRSRRREQAVAEVPDRGTGDVEDEALASISTSRVIEILETLSPDQRSVVALRIIGDLSLRDTAQVLGKRVGAVKSLQKRAFDRLAVILAEAYPNADEGRLQG
jgi:RNA polymerase sigma-70 factor (ECF subfamily)